MATEKRLIDAVRHERVLRRFAEHLMERGMVEGAEAVNTIIKGLMLEPTVDAVEVVHGRWHEVDGETEWECHYRCSKCFTRSYELTNYCPNCGAKMDGDGNG